MKEENSKFFKGMVVGIVLAILLCTGILGVRQITQPAEGPTAAITQKKIKLIESLVDEHYLDEVDENTLTDDMLKGLMNGLGDNYAA